jgi:hypothetical protein
MVLSSFRYQSRYILTMKRAKYGYLLILTRSLRLKRNKLLERSGDRHGGIEI